MSRWIRTITGVKDKLDDSKPPTEVARALADVLESGRAPEWIITSLRAVETIEDRAAQVAAIDDTLDLLYDWADWSGVWIG